MDMYRTNRTDNYLQSSLNGGNGAPGTLWASGLPIRSTLYVERIKHEDKVLTIPRTPG